MLFPRFCSLCNRHGDSPCESCAEWLSSPEVTTSLRGGVPTFSAVFYQGAGRDLLRKAKFHHDRSALSWLADRLVFQLSARVMKVDAVTWITGSHAGLRQRGFDTAQILASQIAKNMQVPALKLLSRRAGPRQSELNRIERMHGPRFDFHARSARQKRFLLVDDIFTTGATVRNATEALMDGGIFPVAVAVAALTPATSFSHLVASKL